MEAGDDTRSGDGLTRRQVQVEAGARKWNKAGTGTVYLGTGRDGRSAPPR